MSVSYSIHSTDSTSSSNTMPTNQLNEQPLDQSNILYNDHQNYQIIFTNDSRFFDTSLHLFKCYRKSGYIQSDNKKPKKSLFSSSTHMLKPQSNGHNGHGRSKSAGFRTNYEVDGHNDATLKPATSRNNDHLNKQRSDRNPSQVRVPKLKHENPHGSAPYQGQWPSSNHTNYNGDSSDDPDIIVTRL